MTIYLFNNCLVLELELELELLEFESFVVDRGSRGSNNVSHTSNKQDVAISSILAYALYGFELFPKPTISIAITIRPSSPCCPCCCRLCLAANNGNTL